jgi:cell division protein FtsL
MKITALELREQIAEIDQKLTTERTALKDQRAKIRELRQAREIKAALLRRIEEQGLDSVEFPNRS